MLSSSRRILILRTNNYYEETSPSEDISRGIEESKNAIRDAISGDSGGSNWDISIGMVEPDIRFVHL